MKSPNIIVLDETEQQRAFRELQKHVNRIFLYHIVPLLYSPDWHKFFMPSERECLVKMLEQESKQDEKENRLKDGSVEVATSCIL